MSGLIALPHLQHCHVQEITQGIYVAQPKSGGGGASNAGIVDLGNITVVFDTMRTPAAATELRQVAELLTKKPVKLLINSHYHEDHVGGNQAFDTSVDIISTAHTRRLMAEQGPKRLAWHKQHGQNRLLALEAAANNAVGKAKTVAQAIHGEYQHVVDGLETMTVRLPNITFEQQVQLYGALRRVEILTYGGGHTQSDTILYLPDDNIIFMGDLLTTHNHPFLGDGDPGELPRILDIINLLNPQQIIPGHGPISSIADVQSMQAYLAMLTETALTELAFQFEDEVELEQRIISFPIPSLYRDWGRTENFTSNLRFLYRRMMTAYAD